MWIRSSSRRVFLKSGNGTFLPGREPTRPDETVRRYNQALNIGKLLWLFLSVKKFVIINEKVDRRGATTPLGV